MTASVWFPFLARHRFSVSPSLIPLATGVSVLSLFNSFLGGLSELVYGGKASKVLLDRPPLFVIGHWRTGSTLLHELLVTDSQFSFPNTYQCMAPSHFLLTSRIFGPLIDLLMPRNRPMDSMAVGWRHPQEDEMALLNMGVGSNYRDWAFPNAGTNYDDFLTLQGVSEKELNAWKRNFLWFLKRLTVHDSRQIVLKSPTHTARIRVLLDLFPAARFLHIVRDPREVLPSTLRTWTRMTDSVSLQVRRKEFTMEGRIAVFNKMYDCFFEDRIQIPDGHLHEIHFEDLISDPEAVLQRAYEVLELGSFENARQGIREYVGRNSGFQRNRYELTEETERMIVAGCQRYMMEYGYE